MTHLRLPVRLRGDDPELRSGKQKARCGDRTDGPGPEGKSGVRVLHGPAQLLVVMPESEAQQPPQA